jgi:hypothetical protein
MIAAGQVTAAKIATDAITAGKIEAGAVTANKITVDGEVTVSSSTQASGAFSVKDADNANAEVLRLGDISSKGVGSDYGLWGALGTGVFIEGAARVVGTAEVLATGGGSNGLTVSEGQNVTSTVDTSISLNGSTSFTVPSGKKWVALNTIYDHAPLGTSNLWALNRKVSLARATNSSSTVVSVVFPAGSYTGLNYRASHTYIAVRAATGAASGLLEYAWILFIEVDA